MTNDTVPAVAKPAPAPIPVTDNGMFAELFDSGRFAQMQRVATLFSQSKLVPEHFRGDMPSCFVGIQMAVRLGVDPFMMLQNTYVVHGRPGMEAKLVIALINQRGPFEGPIQWTFKGTGKGRSCTAWAVHKKTGQKCEATVSWEMAEAEGWTKKTGSKWLTIPDQMFQYRSAAFLGRLYCPEVLMGLPTLDELHDITAEAGPPVRISTPADGIADAMAVESPGMAADFDQMANERGVDVTALSRFVVATASIHKCPVDDIKAKAVEDQEGFWAAFEAWQAKHNPGQPAPKAPRATPAMREEAKQAVESAGLDLAAIEKEFNTYAPSWSYTQCQEALSRAAAVTGEVQNEPFVPSPEDLAQDLGA